MNSSAVIKKFYSVLPVVRNWIDDLLEGHIDQATPVIKLEYQRLRQVFPSDLLEKAKVVIVAGKVPFPPLARMGLFELEEMEHIPMAGITYKDTFFVNQVHRTKSLHFHELVHVVQWERLCVDNFLLAYGVGLMQFGYHNSPLEQIAYSLQKDFDRGSLPSGIVEAIGQKTDAIWSHVASLVSQV